MMRRILIGGVLLAAFFGLSYAAMEWLAPRTAGRAPVAAKLPPLPPPDARSRVVAPITIPLAVIQQAVEAQAPRGFNGKRDNPFAEALGKAEVLWNVSRGGISVTGRPEGLTLATALTGGLRLSGQAPGGGGEAGNLGRQLSGLLGGRLGERVEKFAGQLLEQRADIRGSVSATARPQIRADWRIEPNLSAQVSIGDGGVSIAGLRLNVANEVKPTIDRAIAEQTAALAERIRNDPSLEQAARREWQNLCRAVPLGAPMPGGPNLWLELRPVQAVAAQPRITAEAAVLTLGVQAATRIGIAEIKPVCPFPAKLDLVPAIDDGRMAIAVPIDLPLADLSKLLDAQLRGRTFPENADRAAEVTVKKTTLSAAGDRLAIALDVEAKERKSWFGLAGAATVHITGRPVLDGATQVLRLDDVALDIQSEGAFGLLGAAARAAVPYLEAEIRKQAQIDLKPFATQALASLRTMLADLTKQGDGVRADISVKELRLAGIAFDQTTLRVIAEADGAARVAVTKVPGL